MNARFCYSRSLMLASVAALATIAGCSPSSTETVSDQTSSVTQSSASDVAKPASAQAGSTDDEQEHDHKPGAHGGIMVSLGRDSYHVEAVIDSEGNVRLYTLGKDESRVIEVESQSLKGFVRADGEEESKPIAFEPSPQDGDAPGKTSMFIAKLPSELVGRRIDVTIPNIRIEGERFRLGFVSSEEGHGNDAMMPDKLADNAERELYLTPGGRYTKADIEANGNVTASQKFKGIKSSHNMNPATGDRICPITETKANPKFTWIIDGKPYQFCCPPCVDEFLKMAKLSEEPLRDPETYVKP